MPFTLKKELTDDDRRKLSEMNTELNKTKFVKLNDGEKILLYFDPQKCSIIYKDFGDGEDKKLYHFEVYDPNLDLDRVWDTANVALVKDIVNYLQKGVFFLKISRKGIAKQTTYFVEGAQ